MSSRLTGRRRTASRYSSYSSPYNYGSTARAYTAVPPEKRREEPEAAPAETIRIDEYGLAHRAALVGIMVLMAVLAIAFLCLYGYNYQLSTDISTLQTELNELKEDNYYLENEFDNNLNLDYIEEVAINKLGMQKPSSYQIKYISVPKQSYTILYNTDEEQDGFLYHLLRLDFKSALDALIGSD
ncbi:MAG: septum formation initiator family protein [Clostridiales bacterium]|nr:septum formation initiator family protein [Clostridiales bacterium]